MVCCEINYGFLIEFFYSLVIFLTTLFIYFNTKQIYDLTKHKGLNFFRKAFIFFGFAYFVRFLLYLLFISDITLSFCSKNLLIPIVISLMCFFSTLAIFNIGYSIFWKRIENKNIIILFNIIAVIFAIIAYFLNSLITTAIIQSLIILILFICVILPNKQKKKFSQMKLLYLLIMIFWIVNLLSLSLKKVILFELKMGFHIISIIIIIVIYYKISKWLK